jgi:hypothetical protein
MTIAIDYDGTFAADPEMFWPIITIMKAKGHQVVIVTGRSEDFGHEIKQAVGNIVPIVFAGMQWKRKAAEAAGYKVNIWIDDNPEYIDAQKVELLEHKHE